MTKDEIIAKALYRYREWDQQTPGLRDKTTKEIIASIVDLALTAPESRMSEEMVEAAAQKICCPKGCQGSPSTSVCISYQVKHVARAALEAALSAAPADGWRAIESAPKDGTIFDVWLGDAEQSDVEFYCTPGTRRSASWYWKEGKFRPAASIILTTFNMPTHWRPLPLPPKHEEADHA